jgi:hypothetical protein
MLWTVLSVFGWIVTIGIPPVFVRMFWREWIELDAESISWGAVGPLARSKKTIPMSRIAEVSFGQYSGDGDTESSSSLNVFELPGALGYRRRHHLAYWVSEAHKEAIFRRIRDFVQKRSIPLKVGTC